MSINPIRQKITCEGLITLSKLIEKSHSYSADQSHRIETAINSVFKILTEDPSSDTLEDAQAHLYHTVHVTTLEVHERLRARSKLLQQLDSLKKPL